MCVSAVNVLLMKCSFECFLFLNAAEPILPIGKDTLVYGSNDGGITVIKKNKEISKKMRLAAKKINLNKHSVGNVIRKKIFGPGPFIFAFFL
jgi:hypothetical protein